MQPSSSTIRKLEHLQGTLEIEFSQVPTQVVDLHVMAVAEQLLERANFDDFVPLLTDRYVRAELAAVSSA
jgi:hypothetical protein